MKRFFWIKRSNKKPFIIFLWSIQFFLEICIKVLGKIKNKLWKFIWPKNCDFDYQSESQSIAIERCGIVNVIGKAIIPVDLLRVRMRIPEGVRISTIEETPHYKWFKDLKDGGKASHSEQGYKDYILNYEHKIDIDKRMKEVAGLFRNILYSLEHKNEVFVIVLTPELDFSGNISFVIVDGVHRASIAKASGCRQIQAYFVP